MGLGMNAASSAFQTAKAIRDLYEDDNMDDDDEHIGTMSDSERETFENKQKKETL